MAAPVHRLQRAAFFFATYGALAALSLWFAYELRFAGEDALTGGQHQAAEAYLYLQRPMVLLWLIPLKVLLLGVWGQFRGVFYYFRLTDALRMVFALAAATAIAFTLPSIIGSGDPAQAFSVPRGVTLVDFNLSLVLFVGFRVSIRALRERFWSKEQATQGAVERIAIVGAGQAGAQLAAELMSRRGHGIEPVCFLDDDVAKHNLHIHGVPVIGAPERMPELAEKYGVTEIILALPASAVRRIREVSTLASANNLRVLVVPSMSEMAGGRVRASDIRPISVEDILGREPAKLDDEAIDAMVKGRTVLITGAGGSIGSELCRQVAARSPARLIMLDQCEVLLYQAEQELISAGAGALITPIVGDVTDVDRMRDVFTRFKPELVLHAAAHKHVPMMERAPKEAIKNNVFGTKTVADLADRFGAERFVFVSTDKAVRPSSVMGATKRIAELYIKDLDARSAVRFTSVRFGNVMGSAGSVIPLFQEQIARGGPVTVTHPEMERFFMTIPEAARLVLEAAGLSEGGEVMLLDMGSPVKIRALAENMIRLSGREPYREIDIVFTGMRPGEKLQEELALPEEVLGETPCKKIFVWRGGAAAAPMHGLIARLREPGRTADEVRQALREALPEFRSPQHVAQEPLFVPAVPMPERAAAMRMAASS
jgi:FlaA1/EpsC-like NDP-sugar epimerase